MNDKSSRKEVSGPPKTSLSAPLLLYTLPLLPILHQMIRHDPHRERLPNSEFSTARRSDWVLPQLNHRRLPARRACQRESSHLPLHTLHVGLVLVRERKWQCLGPSLQCLRKRQSNPPGGYMEAS